MKMFWLLVALWNTLVAMVNVTILPYFGPAAMTYITPTSQLLPIAIPLVFYLLSHDSVRRTA